MGCSNSKSTPVVESNGSALVDTLAEKSEDIRNQISSDIGDFVSDVKQKSESLIDDLKPSTLLNDDDKIVPDHESIPQSDLTDSDAIESDDEKMRRVESDSTARVEDAASIEVDDEDDSGIRDRIDRTDGGTPEDDSENLEMNQLPVKMSVSLGDADESADEDKLSSETPE